MIVLSPIDPVAFSLGPLAVRWYGLSYLVGLSVAWWLGRYRAKQPNSYLKPAFIEDLVIYSAFGVLIGGRLGYILFYNFQHYLSHPLDIFSVWEGGMSFHGGVLGVICTVFLFSYLKYKDPIKVADFACPCIPPGLFFGRLGNFINSELWGRPTDAPWGVVFPNIGYPPRHPSQLYEALLEGLVLFIILWIYSSKPRKRFGPSGLFLLGYGVARFIVEFYREPDLQLGYIGFNWLTMGQLLSIPMILIGGAMLYYAEKVEK
ncbi:prolipoprotein diacylglyceryl transferase [Desulfovibrio litoralis]|uniref:Phosphatidylglycerol--prolipoprotein diacylglyceryl transferase n=1 Tax=Desulfovibrio litoralis DSM 11393 TaxID=1121455 RepID=A0A1M7SBV8_9BACT|nr:prolipoprotein diacylglyceryl transferase [Desulfovibrio litoralis]SHN55945.1 phosphatidylglycerol:prolipoprotein diacylglycerol transferase [Desulfovibrio litoralis DSM 11393]